MKKLKVIVSGGGTGGHIFPAISIANELKERCPDAEILFVGALGKMEMERVPAAGYRIIGLPVVGFPRKPSFKMVGFFLILTVLAIFVIFHFAASKATIKIYGQIQEQDYKTLIEMLPENSQALATNQIFGKILTQEIESEVSIDSEMTTSTATKAGGFVKLINQSTKDQTLVATTRLLSSDNKLLPLYQLDIRLPILFSKPSCIYIL